MDSSDLSSSSDSIDSSDAIIRRNPSNYNNPPYEYSTRLLFFYLIVDVPNKIAIRLPDGCYIGVIWGDKFRLTKPRYNELMNLTHNLKKNIDEAYIFVDRYSGYDEDQEYEVVLPKRDNNITILDTPFTSIDSLYQMVPGSYFHQKTIKYIYREIFDNPSDVFRGKSGLWSKLSYPVRKLSNGNYVPWTGQFNNYGVMIL